jgi:hypothetical protein
MLENIRIVPELAFSIFLSYEDNRKVEERPDAIERELADIKIGHSSPQSPRVVKLKGLWKRLQVNKQGIAKAKSSLFKDTSD